MACLSLSQEPASIKILALRLVNRTPPTGVSEESARSSLIAFIGSASTRLCNLACSSLNFFSPAGLTFMVRLRNRVHAHADYTTSRPSPYDATPMTTRNLTVPTRWAPEAHSRLDKC